MTSDELFEAIKKPATAAEREELAVKLLAEYTGDDKVFIEPWVWEKLAVMDDRQVVI